MPSKPSDNPVMHNGNKDISIPKNCPNPLWDGHYLQPKPLFPHPITKITIPIPPGYTTASNPSLYIADIPTKKTQFVPI